MIHSSLLTFLLFSICTAQNWNMGQNPPLNFNQQFPSVPQQTVTNTEMYEKNIIPSWGQNTVGQGAYQTYGRNSNYGQKIVGRETIPVENVIEVRREWNRMEKKIEDTIRDSIIDKRQITNEGEVGRDKSDRKARLAARNSRSYTSTPSMNVNPQLEQSFSLDDLKEICPPPTIKYIVLRVLKNGLQVAEEAEEVTEEGKWMTMTMTMIQMPVTSNVVAQKIVNEVEDVMNGVNPSGKREVSPSEIKEKKRFSSTTNAPIVEEIEENENGNEAEEIQQVDDKCNSEMLRKLIVNNIVPGDAGASKRAIHLAVTPATASVDVICSTTGFTYLVTTTDHCEAQTDGVICFAYRTE